MAIRSTITISTADEPAFLKTLEMMPSVQCISIKKLGPAEILSKGMGVDCVYYDIFMEAADEMTASTTLFQLGMATAFLKVGIDYQQAKING